MSQKYDNFMLELEKLCKEHQVAIAVSDYDSIQIYSMNHGGEFIHASGIEDMTEFSCS